jgi:hypothetical protein
MMKFATYMSTDKYVLYSFALTTAGADLTFSTRVKGAFSV